MSTAESWCALHQCLPTSGAYSRHRRMTGMEVRIGARSPRPNFGIYGHKPGIIGIAPGLEDRSCSKAHAPGSGGGFAPAARTGYGDTSLGPTMRRHRGAYVDARRQWKRRSRPISRVLSWTVIPLGAASPLRSSNLPGSTAGRGIASLFGLAPGGVCRAGPLPDSRCALTAPFHPCHALRKAVRRYLSVALSVGSRRPGVTWHRALWSPDFPRHACA